MYIKKIDFIKIDAEGEDLNVLRGLKKNINNINSFMVEFNLIFNDSKELFDFIVEKGFDIFDMRNRTKEDNYNKLKQNLEKLKINHTNLLCIKKCVNDSQKDL